MTRKLDITFKVIFFAYLAAVIFLCFGKFENLPQMNPLFLGIPKDKVVHFLMFFPFPILVFLAFDRFTTKPWHSLLFCLGVFLLGCIVAAATEIGQSYTQYRSGDPNDFRADILAVAISSIIVLIIDLKKQKHE